MEPWLIALLRDFGPLTVLVFAVIGATRGVFVLQRHHFEVVGQYEARLQEAKDQLREMTEDRDYYRDALLAALRTAENASIVAERAPRLAKDRA